MVMDSTIKKLTYYHSETRVTKMTKIGKPRSNERQIHFKLTVGRPNYAESKYIKRHIKEKGTFPITNMHIKRYPKR